jgi:hypothetical protein
MNIKKLTLSIAFLIQATSSQLFAADLNPLNDTSSLAAETLSCRTDTSGFGNSIQRQYETKFPGTVMGDLFSWAPGTSTTESPTTWIAIWKRATYPNFLHCQEFAARLKFQTRYGEVVRYSKALNQWTARVELISYIDGLAVAFVSEDGDVEPCTFSPEDAKLILINRTAEKSSALCAGADATISACREKLIASKTLTPIQSCTFQAPANGSFISFDKR